MDRQLGFRGRLVIAVGVVFIIAGSLTLWLFRRSDFIAQTPFLSRLTQVSVEENQSTENRLITWRSALQGAADRPVFGWGVNSAYYALNRYYNPRHALFTGNFAERSKTWYDKTHNAHIEMLLERGLAGAALYWISIFFALRYVRRISDRFLSRCLTAFLVAHLCSNAVAFDSYGSFFVFYLLLACIVVLGKPGSPPASATRRQRRDGGKSRPAGPGKAWRAPAAIAAGLVLVAGAYANVGIAMAVHGYARAREAFESDPAAGIAAYADAFRHFSPYHPRQKLDCAYLLVNSAITKRGASRSFEGGALFTRLTREALAAHPDDAEFYVLLNDTYNGLAVLSDKRFAAEAQGFGRKALELSPRRQEAIFTLARSYLLSNEPTRAVELNRQIVAHTPDFALGRWFLALSLLADGRPDEAKEQLRHAFRLGYRFQSEEERKSIVGLLGEAEYLELLRSK